jgi:hypothetical protein
MNKEKKLLPRRDFVKLSASSAILSGISFKSIASQVSPNETDEKKFYIGRDTRLTIAMWDFTWLTAHHKGGTYENLEQRVREAAERGFNTLRIDCFPSRVLDGKSVFIKNYDAGRQLPFWGQTGTDHEDDVLKKLTLLSNVCRKYNIMLGLDSWEKGHMLRRDLINLHGISDPIKPEAEEKTFRQFSDTWVKALKLMREEGILERTVWVAPMNEVPHFLSRSLQSIKDINSEVKNEGETKLERNEKINNKFREVNHWMGEAIKEEINRDKIPLSYSSLGAEQFHKRLTDIYDVVDVHFMPEVVMNDEQKTTLSKMVNGGSGFKYFENMKDLKAYSALWDNSCRTNYAAMLTRTRDYFRTCLNNMTLEGGKKLQGIITESYGPCYWPDHKDVSWDWYKKYNADALRIAASMPYTGLSLSNYSEPIFTLWDDIDWHRNSNLFTLNIF